VIAHTHVHQGKSANSLKKKFPPKDNEEEAESERIYPSKIFSILTA